MFYFGEVDFKTSIKTKKLVFINSKYKWNKVYAHIVSWFPFFLLTGTIYYQERHFFTPGLIFLAWGIWSSYLKEKETELVKVNSRHTKEENEKIIRNHINNSPLWELKKTIDGNYLCETNFGLGIFDKIAIVMFDNNSIYIAVLGNNTKIKAGTFLSKKQTKKDLEEALNKKLLTTQA